MHFEEELTIRELRHLIDRIQELSLYANNLDQLPNSSVDERSAAPDFKEYLTHKYQIVIRVLQIKFRQRGTSRQRDEIGYFFDGFPSESDDELRAEIERRRAQIQSEKRLYEDVARAFKIGPDDRLWPNYQLPLNSEEPDSTSTTKVNQPGPTISNGVQEPGEPFPLEPAGHSEPEGRPSIRTTDGMPSKRREGRPTHPATLAYIELTSGKKTDPTLAEICKAFDKKKVPLAKMLSPAGSWKEALKTQTARVQSWKNEQRRPPR